MRILKPSRTSRSSLIHHCLIQQLTSLDRPVLFRLVIIRRILPYISNLGPPSFRRFIVKLIPSSDVQKMRGMVDVMDNTSIKIFQAKKAAWEKGDEAVVEQVGRGKDIMSILRMFLIHAFFAPLIYTICIAQ